MKNVHLFEQQFFRNRIRKKWSILYLLWRWFL